jgi:hypothetical protein
MRAHDVCPNGDRQQPKGCNDGQRQFLFASHYHLPGRNDFPPGKVLPQRPNLPAREWTPGSDPDMGSER